MLKTYSNSSTIHFIQVLYLFRTKINIKMKNALLLLFVSTVFFASCGGTKNETIVIPGMKQVEISIAGNPLTIFAPDSTAGPMQITEKPWGAIEITVGDDFQISIEEGPGDIALLKSDIAGDDVYKLQKYVKDEPNLLFWEVKILEMEGSKFHFYNIVPVGNIKYVIKDVETGESYSQKAIEKMLEASQTLKAKVKPDA